MRSPVRSAALLLALAGIAPSLLFAQAQDPPRGILAEVGIDQNLDAALPLDLEFRDEEGRAVRLGHYFRDRPVLLSFVYHSCPMLCSYVLYGQVRALRAMAFTPGDEFEAVTVSFDPSDTPAMARDARHKYLQAYGREGATWHFLTGDQNAIDRLTEAAGFRYARDEETGQFAHAAAAMIATPDGRLARYLYGVEYSARDLRLALVEASQGQIGSPVDQVLLYCFHYDPLTGRYGVVIMNVLRVAGAATVAALVLGMVLMSRAYRRGGRADAPGAST